MEGLWRTPDVHTSVTPAGHQPALLSIKCGSREARTVMCIGKGSHSPPWQAYQQTSDILSHWNPGCKCWTLAQLLRHL